MQFWRLRTNQAANASEPRRKKKRTTWQNETKRLAKRKERFAKHKQFLWQRETCCFLNIKSLGRPAADPWEAPVKCLGNAILAPANKLRAKRKQTGAQREKEPLGKRKQNIWQKKRNFLPNTNNLFGNKRHVCFLILIFRPPCRGGARQSGSVRKRGRRNL